jgi:hypothetical protein
LFKIRVRTIFLLPEAVVYVIGPLGVMIKSAGLTFLTFLILAALSCELNVISSAHSFSWCLMGCEASCLSEDFWKRASGLAFMSYGSYWNWLLLWLGSISLSEGFIRNGARMTTGRSSVLVSFCSVVSLADASFSLSYSGCMCALCLLLFLRWSLDVRLVPPAEALDSGFGDAWTGGDPFVAFLIASSMPY